MLIQGAGGGVATAAAALARAAGLRAAFERALQPDLYGKVIVSVGET